MAGQVHRDPVRLVAGHEKIVQFQIDFTRTDRGRKAIQLFTVRCSQADIGLAHAKETVVFFAPQQPVEGKPVVHPANPCVVKGIKHLFVNHDIPASQAFFHVLEAIDQGGVVFKKGVLTTQLLIDQCCADKDIPSFQHGFFIDPAVFNFSSGNNGQTKEADPFKGQHLAAPFFPVGIGPGTFAEIAAQLLQPVRLDCGHGPGKHLGRLDELSRDRPLGPLVV